MEKVGVSQGNLEVKKRNLLQQFNGEQIKGGTGRRSPEQLESPLQFVFNVLASVYFVCSFPNIVGGKRLYWRLRSFRSVFGAVLVSCSYLN